MQPQCSRAGAKWIFAALVALALIPHETRADEATERVLPVAVRTLERSTYAITLPEKVGILEAAASLTMSFEVSGTVERIAGEGVQMEPGGVIAALDTRHEAAEVERAQLLLAEARREFGRVRGLKKAQAVSQSAYEAASTAVELRRAELDLARERLNRRTLHARFSGVVADVGVDPGEVVVPGKVVARLMNFGLMQIEVGVPGRQIADVRPGARVDVLVPALPEQRFEGTVHLVAPSAQQNSVLFKVDVLIPNPDRVLKPGMSARARIVTREIPNALAIPLEASVARGGRRVAYFVDQGRARAVPVDDAWLHGDRLVLDTDTPGLDLVVRGQHSLDDGLRVEVDNAILGNLDGARLGQARPAVSTRP